MYGIRYPSQQNQGAKRVDHWTVNIMNSRVNPYSISSMCGINSNTYIGSDAIYGANSRSLMNQFNAKTVAQRFSNIFLPEYVS